MVLTFRGQVKPTAQIRIFEEGSPQEPSIAFANASSTGLFLANADTGSMGLASNGVSALEVTESALLPAGTETYDLGSADKRFGSLWLAANTLHLGNVVLKEENGSLVGNGSGLSGIVAANITGLTQALDVIQATSVDVTGNVTASYFVGNGSYLEGVTPPLSITTVDVTDNTWTPVDDTAVSLDGGYIKVTGSGFAPGSIVTVDGTNASSTSYVSSSILHCVVGAKASGTYAVSVIRGDTTVATKPAALTYSANVTWVTSSGLGNVYFADPYSITLEATSDSNVTYANTTALPVQTTLAVSGNLEGNITSVTTDTLYSLDITATDEELQDTSKTFLLNYKSLNVSNVQVTDNAWTVLPDLAVDTAGGNVLVTGSTFLPGDTVSVDGTSANTTYVSGTSLRVEVPAKSSGTYSTAVVRNGLEGGQANLVYNPVPAWITAADLGTVYASTPFTITLVANGATTYSNVDVLPPNTTLTSNGTLSGNISAANPASYTFSAKAVNTYLQSTLRSFTLSYNAYVVASGGILTISDGYMYHTFTANGQMNITSPGEFDLLIVGGGGGGGLNFSGGGGGGYVVVGTNMSASIPQTVPVVVGSGGVTHVQAGYVAPYGYSGRPGGNSSVVIDTVTYTALGGGGGSESVYNGGNGAGGNSGKTIEGASTSYTGGARLNDRAGGGGAGANSNAVTGGVGGEGLTVWGVTYGGGGGGGRDINQGTAGTGGSGGGGAGQTGNGSAAVPGTNGLGGGGGGGGGSYGVVGGSPAIGGSGVVIVRYQTAREMLPPNMATASGSGTSWTLNGYTATASSVYDTTNYVTRNAFDRTLNPWISQSTFPSWIQIQFPAAQTITQYQITSRKGNYPTYTAAPYTWELQGSNNGSTWTTLDTHTNNPVLYADGKTVSFTISSPGSYTYYRVYVTAVYSNGQVYSTTINNGGMFVAISNLNFFT